MARRRDVQVGATGGGTAGHVPGTRTEDQGVPRRDASRFGNVRSRSSLGPENGSTGGPQGRRSPTQSVRDVL
jgi:hypothetical protein